MHAYLENKEKKKSFRSGIVENILEGKKETK